MLLHTIRMRLAVAVAMVLCMVACLTVSRATLVPVPAMFEASLLRQPSPVMAMLVVAISFLGCAALVSVALGRWRPEAGLFTAAVGVAVYAIRGGSMTQTLQYADGRSVFLQMLVELVLLYGVVVVAAMIGCKFSGNRAAVTNDDPEESERNSLNQNLLAIAVQVVVMGIVLMMLGQGESKKQAMWAVGLAAYVGAVGAHWAFPIRRGEWLAMGPLFVGMVGYAMAFVRPPLIAIGIVQQPLATPLPLHYVSMGIAGALLGHWMSRKWQEEALERE